MGKRKGIPNYVKNFVRERQKERCCCCNDLGVDFHHVYAASLADGEFINAYNVVFLCEKHHRLFHLGDPETFKMVHEYAWYIIFRKLPEEKTTDEIAEEVKEYFKNEIAEETRNV